MRVIAGRFKGRTLAAPTWPGLRPTSDKLKGTLFDILGAAVPGARVLDGFAGAGALGIEALSRGAADVLFVEADRRAIGLIAENLRRCGVDRGCAMMRGGFTGVLRELPPAQRFDVVLLDPPYDADAVAEILAVAGSRLSPDGLLVLEHAARRPAPADAPGLDLGRRVVAGDSALAFYRPTAGAPGLEAR